MVEFYVPFDSSGTTIDYEFKGNLYNLTPNDLNNTWLYKYLGNGNYVFKVISSSESDIKNRFHLDILNNKLVFNPQGNKSKFDGADIPPQDADMGEMIVKAIASSLFGHPEAQVSIKNDSSISSQITNKENIPNNFVVKTRGFNELDGDFSGNDVLNSYVEQIITNEPDRFPVDIGIERGIPFKQSDTLVMDVSINVMISFETQTYYHINGFSIPTNVIMDVNNMFNGSPGYDDNNSRLAERKWRFIWTLTHDYMDASSSEAIIIGDDGKLPISDPSGGWKYEKLENDNKNKINWYFYRDVSGTYSFNEIDCFYVKLNIQSDSNIPWLTAYSAHEGDGNDGSSQYRSKWDMRGYYDEGGNNVERGRNVIMYFGIYSPNNTFEHINGTDPELDVLTYRQSEVSTNVGPLNNNEKITDIVLSTDSSVSHGDYNFTVKQVGYRISSNTPVITSLI
jgi:hypothetical protein